MASAERKRELRAQAKSELDTELDDRVRASWKYPATAQGLIDWAEGTLPVLSGWLAGKLYKIEDFQRELYEAILDRDGNYPKYYTVGFFCPRQDGEK